MIMHDWRDRKNEYDLHNVSTAACVCKSQAEQPTAVSVFPRFCVFVFVFMSLVKDAISNGDPL